MPLPTRTDILIAGAGPTGLALATALRTLGVAALHIDRQAEGANTSRAAVVQSRTLEVLEPLGVVPTFLRSGLKVPVFTARDRDRVLLHVDFSTLQTAYPFTLACPQNLTEAILLDRLRSLGGSVLRGVELVDVRFGSEGVKATLACDGAQQTVEAQWLVGCDGAHSLVRERADIGFAGGAYEQEFVLADVRMDWPLGRSEVTVFFSPDGFVLAAPLPDDHFRVIAPMTNAPEALSREYFQAIVDARGPGRGDSRIRQVVWASRFHIQHRIAATLFMGRALLCGDAAHVHSPAGGQGMNTGIQDAVALAEPLARTLRTGDAAELQQWAEKRRQIAENVISMTDRMTTVITATNHALRFVRNAALSFVGHLPGASNLIARKLAELDNR